MLLLVKLLEVIIKLKIAVSLVLHVHYVNSIVSFFYFSGTTSVNSGISSSVNHELVPERLTISLSFFVHRNYIVQDVLKQRNPSHLAIIASCFRNNYVLLSKQRYSSNVVETCLQVFVDAERFFIIDELIWCPHFKDLVTHEFANYVISRALRTCTFPLQHRLATAILSLQNVNRRHPHCLKMFKILSDLGYRH